MSSVIRDEIIDSMTEIFVKHDIMCNQTNRVIELVIGSIADNAIEHIRIFEFPSKNQLELPIGDANE